MTSFRSADHRHATHGSSPRATGRPSTYAARIVRLAETLFETSMAGLLAAPTPSPWARQVFGRELPDDARWRRFASRALQSDGLLLVPDATLDEAFKDDPLVVGPEHLRFYAAVPLRVRQWPVGVLHIADRRPRTLSHGELQALEDLAGIVASHLHCLFEDETERAGPKPARRTLAGQRSALEASRGGVAKPQPDAPTRGKPARVAGPDTTHDALTGLPNRLVFEERLQDELRRLATTADSCAVLRLDMDRFKIVNERIGYRAGDRVMRIVAERIAGSAWNARATSRFDSDGFALILAGTKAADAEAVAERLIQAIREPVAIDGVSVTIDASVGIAVATGPGMAADDLVRKAGLALARSKGTGRGRHCVFEEEQDRSHRDRMRLEFDMQMAVQNQQFTLDYQPCIETKSGRMLGCEALLRWRHPERGLISPAIVIPVAEESGLIVPIGTWCLQEACREAMTWPDTMRIAVNVSVAQICQPGLEHAVMTALAASGLAPHRLELEITETMLMDDSAGVLKRLNRLRALGIRIALDDFGSGFCSLSYLHDLPFDKIKVDQRFIRTLREPATATIVKAVIELCAPHGRDVVAEGVETKEEFALAAAMGFTEIQGYFFSRPVAPDQLAAVIQRFAVP